MIVPSGNHVFISRVFWLLLPISSMVGKKSPVCWSSWYGPLDVPTIHVSPSSAKPSNVRPSPSVKFVATDAHAGAAIVTELVRMFPRARWFTLSSPTILSGALPSAEAISDPEFVAHVSELFGAATAVSTRYGVDAMPTLNSRVAFAAFVVRMVVATAVNFSPDRLSVMSTRFTFAGMLPRMM